MSGRVALGAILLASGVVWLLSAADVVDLSYRIWIGVVLVAIGLAIALLPRGHGALALTGLLVTLAGLPALLVDSDVFGGGVGDRVETPAGEAELEPFRHAVGKLTVDLTSPGLDLDGAAVEASLGIGELVVLLPDDADASFDIHVGIGNAEAFGRTESGLDVDLSGLSGTSGTQELTLELDVGIGNARVARG
jgi:hypothetical protein